MTERFDAKLFQIGVCKVREDALVYIVLDERVDVLMEPQLLEPRTDFVHDLLDRGQLNSTISPLDPCFVAKTRGLRL